MAMVEFKVEYPKDCKNKNEIILLVNEFGGNVYYGGENTFKIKCDGRVYKQLERKIKDMLKT